MAAGLILTTLSSAGPDLYRSGDARFDLCKLYEPRLKLQVAQALDLGFEHRNGTPLMSQTTRSIENAASHGVRFFSVDAEAFAGTSVAPLSGGGEGASSLWRWKGQWMKLDSPVLERDDMRVRINPSDGNYSLDGKGFVYNRLVHILWHELHHCTTTQHHIRLDAPYDRGDPWVGAMVEIARAFPRTARDPQTGERIILISPDQWTFNGRVAFRG